MTVVYDFASERQVSTSAATVTWPHSATISNVIGIAVAIVKGGTISADAITAVSYGGVSLVKIAQAADTSTELGSAQWWSTTVPTAIPQGTRTVAYNTKAIASNIHAVAITFTGQNPAYAIGSGIKEQNTTSFSVSLTTGYVAGIALGALYDGGADPASLSFSTDRTLVHNWDMGAFYSSVIRLTATTAAGFGPMLSFGADVGSDDVAFAAIFLSDATILPGVGSVIAQGRNVNEKTVVPGVGFAQFGNPSFSTEATLTPNAGLVQTVGQIPAELRSTALLPSAGLATMAGLAPTVATGGAIELTITPALAIFDDELTDLVPTILTEWTAKPAVGAIQTVGQIPAEYRERLIAAGVGLATMGGLSPAALGANQIAPTTGLASLQGLAPTILSERLIAPTAGLAIVQGLAGTTILAGTIAPDVGLALFAGEVPTVVDLSPGAPTILIPATAGLTMAGLAPAVLDENDIAPASALVIVNGRAPTVVDLSGSVFTTEPDVGFAQIIGLEPTLSGETLLEPDVGIVALLGLGPIISAPAETIRGHVGTGHRRRGTYLAPEETLSANSIVVTTLPESPAHFELPLGAHAPLPELPKPPAVQVAAVDEEAQTREILRRKRRREEEDVIFSLVA